MYIRQIELENFKNFKEKKIVEFDKGLNIIFGANGTGKSNILDSINFIYGKKDLRVRNDADFFNLSSDNPKSRVKIIFDNCNEIEKVLERNSSGDIKTLYYLNKETSSEGEILEFLKAINLTLIDCCGMSLSVENVKGYAWGLKEQSQNTQIIAISNREPILQAADKIIEIKSSDNNFLTTS